MPNWLTKIFFKPKTAESRGALGDEAASVYSDSLQFGLNFRSVRSSRSLSAVYACVNLISNAISSMPFRVVRVDEHGHKEEVKGHPLRAVFRSRNHQTMGFRQTIKSAMEDVLLHGAGYVYVVRGDTGLITGLRYLPYGHVQCFYDEQKDTIYYTSDLLRNRKLPATDVIHVSDLTRDGVNGISVLAYAKNVMELARSAEDASQEFFDSGCNISGILSTTMPVNQRQRDELKSSWNASQGKKSLQILPFGVKYDAIGTDATKSQLLESREYELTEICRYFGVNPVLIGDLTHSSYNTLEQVNLQFVQYTLQPYVRELEEEFTRKVFSDAESDLVVDVDEGRFLLKSDMSATADYYQKMVSAGIYSVNDARRDLGMSDVADGDEHTVAFSDASKANLANATKANPEEKE